MGSLSTTFIKSRQKKFFLFKYFHQVVKMRNIFLFLLILLAIFSTIEAGSKACKITKIKIAIFGCKSLCDYCHKYYGGKAKCLKVCKQKPCPSTTTTTTTKSTSTITKSTSTTTKSTTTNSTTTTHANTTSTTTKSPSTTTNTTATSTNTTANATKISPTTNKTSKNPTTTQKTTVI